jgi:large subunit ribosomal protein L10
MLNKEQKKKQVTLAGDLIKNSKTLIFADFTGVDTASIRKLKLDIKKTGAAFKVIKKRLLNIAFKNTGVNFDPLQFSAQVGTFFLPEDLSSAAGIIYKFAKELAKSKKEFKVLSAYDVVNKIAISIDEFNAIAKLPSREVLLAMVMGAITGPIRAFLYILSELSKKQESSMPEKVVT